MPQGSGTDVLQGKRLRTATATPTARTLDVRALAALALLLVTAFAPSAAMAVCGDGVFDNGEQCDPGPDVPGDCCDVECFFVGAEVACADDGNQCTFDACDSEGTCAHFNTQGACDDGNPCTLGDFCNPDAQCIPQGLQENGIECPDEGLCGNFGTCQEGACLGDPADCDGVAFACQVATCDPDKRQCQVTQAEDGTACGQPGVCVDGGKCDTGECIPQPKDCSQFTDDCNVGLCDVEVQGGCYASPRQDGTECEDGNGCSVGDSCKAGLCESGSPRDCSSLDDACHVGICNGDLGECQADLRENGSECSDDNPCTTFDTCTNGECRGTPLDCSSFTSECFAGTCNAETGECEAVPTTGACDDGDACTTGDSCSGGECFGTPLDCSGGDGTCATGTCNPQTGQCTSTPVEDGTTCDDGNSCTLRDQCTGGSCAGTPVVCNGGISGCQEFACLPEFGECALVPRADGSPCDDGNACTSGDQCSAGTCGGTPADCSPFDTACTTGSCNPATAGCVSTPREDGSECDDGNACTSGDQCTAGTCTGAPVDCSSLDNECVAGRCNPQVGQCEAVPAGDGTPCDDQAFCTLLDQCIGGVCNGTGDPCFGGAECARTCDEGSDSCLSAAGTACTSDGNPCTDDTCDGDGGCVHTANSEACDDGLYCTSGDTCADGECAGEPTCPRTQGCGDTCNEAEDACRTCGHPFSEERCVVNAIFVLQAAIALRDCELCICDVDDNGTINTSDALRILRTCVNLPVTLECPKPVASTTTTTFQPTTTFQATTTTLLP
jgi:hypothetical protein